MEPATIKSWKGRKVLPNRSRRDQKIYCRQALTCWPTQDRLMWDLWHMGSKCTSSYCLYLQQMKTLLRTSGVWAENWAAVGASSFLPCDGQGLCLQSVKPADADKKQASVLGGCTLVSGRSGFQSCSGQLPEGWLRKWIDFSAQFPVWKIMVINL